MSWNSALDHVQGYWEDIVPDISAICIAVPAKPSKPPDSTLNPEALSPEPRSIEGSELSDSPREQTAPLLSTVEDPIFVPEAEKQNFERETIPTEELSFSAKSVQNKLNKPSQLKTKHEWSAEEDKLILNLYKTHGGNWKKIATFFNGINSSNVKNRFYGCIKRRLDAAGKSLGNERAEENKIEHKANENKPIEEMSAEEKRKKLQSLYHKMGEIENYIKKAKNQIDGLVTKVDVRKK